MSTNPLTFTYTLSETEAKEARARAKPSGYPVEKWLNRAGRKAMQKFLGSYRPCLSPKQAGVELGLSAFTIRRYYRDGLFPGAMSPNGRDIRIPLEDIEKFISNRTVRPEPFRFPD